MYYKNNNNIIIVLLLLLTIETIAKIKTNDENETLNCVKSVSQCRKVNIIILCASISVCVCVCVCVYVFNCAKKIVFYCNKVNTSS